MKPYRQAIIRTAEAAAIVFVILVSLLSGGYWASQGAGVVSLGVGFAIGAAVGFAGAAMVVAMLMLLLEIAESANQIALSTRRAELVLVDLGSALREGPSGRSRAEPSPPPSPPPKPRSVLDRFPDKARLAEEQAHAVEVLAQCGWAPKFKLKDDKPLSVEAALCLKLAIDAGWLIEFDQQTPSVQVRRGDSGVGYLYNNRQITDWANWRHII